MKALLGGSSPELRRLIREAHTLAGPEALACRVRAAMTVDARLARCACPVPILYLRAAADEVVRARCADEIRDLVPSVEIVNLAGPHLALVTNPPASWAALTPFMARTA